MLKQCYKYYWVCSIISCVFNSESVHIFYLLLVNQVLSTVIKMKVAESGDLYLQFMVLV